MMNGQPDQIFYKMGGINTLHDVVDCFYEKVLKDPVINHFFFGTDMEIQRAKMKAFLMMALGGPAMFTGKDIRGAHAGLVHRGLNDTHFDATAQHLEEALKEHNVSDEVRQQILGVVETVRGAVLNKPGPTP
jgi:hemoglobin